MAANFRNHFLPMLKTAGRFAFVDDVADYLGTWRDVLPNSIDASFYIAPFQFGELEADLERTRGLLNEEQALLREVDRAQSIDGMGTSIERALEYFAWAGRHDIVVALVSDHSMPVENGIDFCERHRIPGLQRILLTAIADEHAAIAAFNRDSIEMYMPKQAHTPRKRMIDELQGQSMMSAARRGDVLKERLASAFRSTLSMPTLIGALMDQMEQLQISEYMVLGVPQGILGVAIDGTPYWLQLETEQSLKELLEALEADGSDPALIARVESRKSLANLDVCKQLNVPMLEASCIGLSESPYFALGVFPLGDLPERLAPSVRKG